MSSHISRIRGIRHFGSISRILIKHGLGELIARLPGRGNHRSGLPDPTRIRLTLQELGPSFIKLGQLMSTRADIFPPEYIDEFSKLQDQVPPAPFERIRRLIEAEQGQSLEAIFDRFDPETIAAASVAQVYTAYLKSGEKVAVKVIRPGIEKRIRNDIQVMYYLAGKVENRFELAKILGAVNIVREFERTIFRELDMFIEAGNIDRFNQNFADIDEINAPRIYWPHVTRSVLVMSHVDGIKMDQVAELKRCGIDPKEVAMIGLRSFARQLMAAGIFHADPHPGNTLVTRDGNVTLVDFGIVGYLDEETMLQIAHLFLGFAEHDYDMVMDALEFSGLIDPEQMDARAFRLDIKEISEPFYGRSLKTISVKDIYDQVMRLVFTYRIQMPRNLLLLFKTFIQTEALGKILGSDASLLEVTRPYAKNLLAKGYEAQKLIKNTGRNLRTGAGYLRNMPELTHTFMKRLARGAHRVELEFGDLDRASKTVEKGLNRLTLGLVVSASLIAASLIFNSSKTIMTLEFDFFGLQSISITELLGFTGYSMATLLGLWLFFSIIRSGKR